MQNLKSFRAEKGKFYARHHQSPLTPAQKQRFKWLDYFPENASLRLEVNAEVLSVSDSVAIHTTGGQPKTD